jgi:transposase-like protein
VPISGDNFPHQYAVVADTRRRWSEAEKQAIIGEALQPGVNVSAVARRHGMSIGSQKGPRAKRTPGEHPFVRFSDAILPSRPMLRASRRAERRSRTAACSAAARRACS